MEGGTNAVVPTLGSEGVSPPFWKRHAEAIAERLRSFPAQKGSS